MLYVRGTLLPQDERALAMVGARRPTLYGRDVAERLARDLAAAGLTVVSGLAKGINTTPTTAPWRAAGAPWPCSATARTWSTHRRTGAWQERRSPSPGPCSRTTPRAPAGGPELPAPQPDHLRPGPGRAGGRGRGALGALIADRYALDQGRDVYAVPGPVTSPGQPGAATS